MTTHDATLPPACADDAALEALVSGTLAFDRERALEAHLGGCAACRSRLDALAASPERWSTVREQLSAGAEADRDEADAVPPIPALAALIQKILAPSDDEHMLGRLGPYEITGIIGSGGMGIVLKGHDRALDRFVAIKLLSPHLASSGAARQRFLREAKAAAAVVHDNVIAIHGVDEFAGLPYLVMPYCRGTTLEKRVRDAGPMNLREILRVGLQTARGLAAAHAQGLVHRDVKPANILLEDGVERVRITDFGLARAADDASLTVTGLLAGTPHYMSPEQALGKPLDARSDLFALGAVLFTLATGKPPFRAESSHAVLRMVTDVEPADVRLANPDIPAWLAGIVRRLLAKDPAARYQSAAEVAGTLESCLAHVNDPLAIPLPPEIVHAAPSKPSPVAPAPDHRATPRTFLDSLRRLMSDQRLLSIAALVIFLMALLLPWPILAIGRAEPAIVYAVIATLTSLLFAWLGRRDSLGQLVLKLAGTAAILGGAVVAFWVLSDSVLSGGRHNAERVAAIRAENLAKQAQMEAMARQPNAPVTIAPMTIPVPAAPRVASGPDPMPVVNWPAGRQPAAEMPVLTATVPSSTPVAVAPSADMSPLPQGDLPPGAILLPQAAPVFPTSPPPMGVVPRPNTPTVPGIDMALPAPGTMPPGGTGHGHPAGDATAELADSLERLERWLAEHPHAVVADVTIRRPGALPDQQTITLGPDADIRSYVLQSLEDATTWQQEFTTGFLGRSLAALIRAGSFPVPPTGAGEAGVQMRLEEGDGFQQEVSISGDPKTGAVTTRERRIRFTTNGTFRTLNRTLCKDFREVAPGIWLPHRIDIDSFDIDPDKPENVIPKKACSVTVVVEEWRPQGGIAPAEADAPLPAAEATSGERSSIADAPQGSTDDLLARAPPLGAVSPHDEPIVAPAVPAGTGPPGVTSPGDLSAGLESQFGTMKTELADSLERIERWLAEHPHEAMATVTLRTRDGLGDAGPVSLDVAMPSDCCEVLEGRTTWEEEFTTRFLGRSVAMEIRANAAAASSRTGDGSEVGVETAIEDSDGYQQKMYVSGDPATGAITTRERRIRFTTDGTFRVVNRTVCKDFRELAPGIWLPHRVEIGSFEIDPDRPDNAIPTKPFSVTVVVKEWRPAERATPAAADDPVAAEASTEAVPESATESTDPFP